VKTAMNHYLKHVMHVVFLVAKYVWKTDFMQVYHAKNDYIPQRLNDKKMIERAQFDRERQVDIEEEIFKIR
jgi:hypothetical protein